MPLPTANLTFVEQVTHLGWVESYTIAGDRTPIVAWSGDHSSELCRLSDGSRLERLCPYNAAYQTSLSACGNRIAFVTADPANNNALRLYFYDLSNAQLIATQVATVAQPQLRGIAWLDQDNIATIDYSSSGIDLVIVNAMNGDVVKKLMTLPVESTRIDISPTLDSQGNLLLIIHFGQESQLVQFDPQNGVKKNLIRGNKGAIPLSASWSPTGKYIICLVRRVQKLEAVLLDLVQGTVQTLDTPPLKDLPVWHPDGLRLTLTLDDWPYTRLALYDIQSQQITPFPLPKEMMAAFPQWHEHRCYFVTYAPGYPPTLWSWEEETGQIAALTPSTPFMSLALPKMLAIPSPQGFHIPTLLFESESTMKGTILMLHGGPHGCWRVGWDPVTLALVNAGYRVLLVNTRGSNFKLWHLPAVAAGAFGHDEVEDIGVCLEHLIQRRLAEPGCVAICGHSYGAFIAYRASVRYSDQISAVVITSGYLRPSDLLQSTDKEVQRFIHHAFDQAELVSEPKAKINSACPILLIHGDTDAQIPVLVAIMTAMRLEGDGHELLVLPHDGHAYRQKDNISLWINKMIGFLGTHIAKEGLPC